LKQIEMMTSMQIPSEILIELLIRLQVIREYDSSAYGSASTKCTDHNRKTPVFRERAQRLLEARDDLKLRFSERDLTRDEQDLTTRLADASENERRALNIMKNALATVKANEGRMVSLREEINRHEAALPGLKNAHSNAIRIHALALSSKQAIKEELDTLLSRRTT
jgi:hypothetical protein